MASTPEQRAAARDYWNRPGTIRAARALDWAAALGLTLSIFFAGSLNF